MGILAHRDAWPCQPQVDGFARWRGALALATGLGVLLCAAGCATRDGAGAGSHGPQASVPVALPSAAPAASGRHAEGDSGSRSVAHATEPRAGAARPGALPVPVAPRAVGDGVAHLKWGRPARLDYGPEAAADPVAGYRIYAGPRPDALQLEAQLADPRITEYVMRRLPKGRFWFTVTTYTRLGIESAPTPPVEKLVR